jgi:sporulation protein YlmC with PRC-barrel domain
MTFYLQRKANKYGAKKTTFQGRIYDSKGEAGLAQEIDLLVKAGEVKQVEPQKTFPLYGKNGARICYHRVDFLLTFKDGHQEVQEYKGLATPVWKIKRDLFVDNYPDILYNVITSKGKEIGLIKN